MGIGVVIASAALARAGSDDGLRAAAERISADKIRAHTIVLGGDALEGRAPGTPGGARAAAYIAAQLESFGVEPFGDDGGFLQAVPLESSQPLSGCRLTVSGVGEDRRLRLGEDYLLQTTGAQTWLPRPAPMVFVGYGIVAPEFDYNDYADVDVRGKVAVFLSGEPESEDPDYFAGVERTPYASMEAKMRIALSRGAVGSVLVPVVGGNPEDDWEWLERQYAFAHLGLAYTVPKHLGLLLRPAVARDLFTDALYDFDQVLSMAARHSLRAFHLPVNLSFEGEFRTRSFLAANVVGRIQGSSPKLADTAVVVSAHYDHLGVGPAVDGDPIYNGVIDNAIGVAGVLDIARVLASSPDRPRRSVVVLFTTAEEEGNLGASYFLDHPPVPLSTMVANINVDGLAFFDGFEDVVGIGAELSDLGDILHQAAAQRGLAVNRPAEFAYGREAFERSEQVVFAEAGIPAILVNEGLAWQHHSHEEAVRLAQAWFEQRYHTPDDDLLQPLDFAAAREHAALVLTLVQMVADARQAPEWKPGVPYAYRRLLSVSEEAGSLGEPP
jgi:hypothetical protein